MPRIESLIGSIEAPEPTQPGRIIKWLISGPRPQPDSIVRALLLHSQLRKLTLVMGICSTLVLTITAAVMTDALWAYAWLAIDLAFGVARYVALSSLRKAQANGQHGAPVRPLYFGLSWGTCYGIGCAMCVVSGELPLILLAGIIIAGFSGGVSSRNAGTPRYALVLISVLGTPYTLAMMLSPIPYMHLVGLLVPLWIIGIGSVLFENYDVLLNMLLSERKNHWLANYDALTGLPNRHMQQRRFEQLLYSSNTSIHFHKPLTVLCLDLDGFKAANDCYGHAVGDAVLMGVAQRLRGCVPASDLIFRVGGDEFVILLPGTDDPRARRIAASMIAAITEPFDLGLDAPISIGVSVGSAQYPRDGLSVDDLLRSADAAMYEAKRLGKGTFVQFRQIETAPDLVPHPEADLAAARICLAAFSRLENDFDVVRRPLPSGAKSV